MNNVNKDFLILNNKNIGISEIEFNKNGNLIVTNKSKKYCLVVCIQYNIKDITDIKIGENKNIDFNEYYITENNEPALIRPSISSVKRLNEDILSFYFNFEDLKKGTHYMNNRGHFEKELKSLECNILINYKDILKDMILYKY